MVEQLKNRKFALILYIIYIYYISEKCRTIDMNIKPSGINSKNPKHYPKHSMLDLNWKCYAIYCRKKYYKNTEILKSWRRAWFEKSHHLITIRVTLKISNSIYFYSRLYTGGWTFLVASLNPVRCPRTHPVSKIKSPRRSAPFLILHPNRWVTGHYKLSYL